MLKLSFFDDQVGVSASRQEMVSQLLKDIVESAGDKPNLTTNSASYDRCVLSFFKKKKIFFGVPHFRNDTKCHILDRSSKNYLKVLFEWPLTVMKSPFFVSLGISFIVILNRSWFF
jgi:hypothetical protein